MGIPIAPQKAGILRKWRAGPNLLESFLGRNNKQLSCKSFGKSAAITENPLLAHFLIERTKLPTSGTIFMVCWDSWRECCWRVLLGPSDWEGFHGSTIHRIRLWLTPYSRWEELRDLLERRQSAMWLSPILMVMFDYAVNTHAELENSQLLMVMNCLLRTGASPHSKDVLGKNGGLAGGWF